MANCCYFWAHFGFDTAEACDKYIDKVTPVLARGRRDNEGVFVGSNSWVFDGEVTNDGGDGCSATLHGWVKWALETEDFWGLVKFAGPDAFVCVCEVEEEGNLIYGTYSWSRRSNKVIERFLPDDKWPEPPEEWEEDESKMDEWYEGETERMEQALEKDGVPKFWTADALQKRLDGLKEGEVLTDAYLELFGMNKEKKDGRN